MTKPPIDSLTPEQLGREVAEGMGWKPWPLRDSQGPTELATTWEGAGAILEAMQERGWNCVSLHGSDGKSSVGFWKEPADDCPHTVCDTWPLAIARAAAAALRGEG